MSGNIGAGRATFDSTPFSGPIQQACSWYTAVNPARVSSPRVKAALAQDTIWSAYSDSPFGMSVPPACKFFASRIPQRK